jgi:hypothetical protein
MSTFVLVHGSWHDGSAWNAVIQHLEAKGHQAFAPTVAGHGRGVNKNVNHAQCVQSIVDYIVDKDLTDIILLGHHCKNLKEIKNFNSLHSRDIKQQ